MGRRRLDAELVRRGLAPTREKARAAIEAGTVLVAGTIADKPARLVDAGDPVVLAGPPPRFVSRGGDKLDAALDRFGVDVAGRRALDAGASTGGFTDCLLQRGAAHVVAVDVGRGQFHARLGRDERVRSLERTNVRTIDLGSIGAPFDIVVADLSFISLRTVAPMLVAAAAPGADVVVLVKPQFEVGRQAVSRGKGVVREPALWHQALEGAASALRAAGAAIMGAMASPLKGADGNVEFLVHARAHLQDGGGPDDMIDAAVQEATA